MTVYVEYQNINKSGIKKREQNHLEVTQKLSEQHTWKSRNQGNTENRHTGTADIVKELLKQKNKTFIHGNNMKCNIHCNTK
jgi:hypothetical protein